MKRIFFLVATILLMAPLAGQKKVVLDSCVDSRDGKVYKAVLIGKQVWMAENLSYSCEGSFVYDDQEKNVKKLGRLYTYEASTKACPTGWHLPLKAEWNDMEKFIDPKEEGILGDKLAKKSYPGFNVVMAGFKNPKGKYLDKDVSTFFWGSDNVVNLSKEGPGMIYSLYEELSNKDKKNCFPIRCIKD